MKPLIKWPGGKSGEIEKIEKMIPVYERYIEPFLGGGALFFHLKPPKASVNDISKQLTDFYKLVSVQDNKLNELLLCYGSSFTGILKFCEKHYDEIHSMYQSLKAGKFGKTDLKMRLAPLTSVLPDEISGTFPHNLLICRNEFVYHINKMVSDKMHRTVFNSRNAPFSDAHLKSNLITGFISGYYMYFRKVYNDINLERIKTPSIQYKAANFYFIREYCYGAMFRYNLRGEFNIPYGGMTYNKKNFRNKTDYMFSKEAEEIFKNTDISCSDFEIFLDSINPTANDFIFIDPPYDTDFSDYEGRAFTNKDQERLASFLKKTPAKFILIIKNTAFIHNLYRNGFNIFSFDNKYSYNVKSRNSRSAEHLVITNLSSV